MALGTIQSRWHRHRLRVRRLGCCLWLAAPAAAAADSGAQDAPLSLAGIVAALQNSVLAVWAGFVERLPFLAIGMLVLLATWIGTAVFRHSADRLLAARGMRPSLRELVERLAVIAIWSLGSTVAALVVFPDLTPAKALGGLGLLSIAFGLAFRDIFENFFAGILLLWNFPFENGDAIECQDIVGIVERVSVRMTLIRKFSGELIVVPNSHLLKNPVVILTQARLRRVNSRVVLAYGQDMPAALELIAEAVKDCDSVHTEQPIQIFPHAFGESGLEVDIRWWADSETLAYRRSRAQVLPRVLGALADAGIRVAVPHRRLQLPEPLEVHAEPPQR